MNHLRKLITIASLTTSAISFAAPEIESVPGEYIVKLKNKNILQSQQLAGLEQSMRANVKTILPINNLIVVTKPTIELQAAAISSLQESPDVEYAEPNYIYRASKTPNDSMFSRLWGMFNQPSNFDIGATKAWDIQTGNKDLVIAVIDTGVDYTHPDIAPNIWTNQAELNGKPGVDDDGNGFIDDIHGYNFDKNIGDSKDDHGHGTHCSGTIAGRGDNGIGVTGVVWQAKVMGVKFLSKDGGGSLEGAIKSIDYATKMGAKIMSNSWGGGGFSQALKEVIETTHKNGVLFVAAAGNETNNNDAKPSYPASYDVPNVISVAAVDKNGKLASFSNYGKRSVHVAAPGVDIVSTVINGKYDTYSGTSMATPHVSGIAALVWSEFPNMTNLELKDRILKTAQPAASLRGKVQTGMANAFTAITNQQPGPDLNDPINWRKMAVSISSEHPYKEKTNQKFVVTAPGAKEFAIQFSGFETEEDFDTVVIKDMNGKVLDKLSGKLGEVMSSVIPGDKATLEFTSDESVNGNGFDITEVAWR